MSVLWTALLAAAVSALVALLIEFAAKPGLEARKDRILKERTDLRELRRLLLYIMEREREGWTANTGARDRDLTRYEELADQVFEQMHACADLLPSEVRVLAWWGLDHYRGTFPVEGMPLDFDSHMRLKDDFADAVYIVDDYVSSLGWWRWRKRKRIQEKARARYAARFQPNPNESA